MLDYGMNIPIFPLNTVLFPGMMLPLHIFEDRYKLMIQHCLADDNIFGVVLAKTKQAQAPQAINVYTDDIYPVGTTAQITAVEHLKDNRMNLITVGAERFIIKNIKSGQHNFLIGEVDPFPMPGKEDTVEINDMANKLKPMVQEYIEHLADASGEDISNATLPSNPKALAYLAGTAMQGPLTDKQQLLASGSLSQLILKTANVLDRENKILAYMINAYHAHQQLEKLPFVDYSLN